MLALISKAFSLSPIINKSMTESGMQVSAPYINVHIYLFIIRG